MIPMMMGEATRKETWSGDDGMCDHYAVITLSCCLIIKITLGALFARSLPSDLRSLSRCVSCTGESQCFDSTRVICCDDTHHHNKKRGLSSARGQGSISHAVSLPAPLRKRSRHLIMFILISHFSSAVDDAAMPTTGEEKLDDLWGCAWGSEPRFTHQTSSRDPQRGQGCRKSCESGERRGEEEGRRRNTLCTSAREKRDFVFMVMTVRYVFSSPSTTVKSEFIEFWWVFCTALFYDSYFRRIIFIPPSTRDALCVLPKSRQMWFFS